MTGNTKTNRLSTLQRGSRAVAIPIASAPASRGIMVSVGPPLECAHSRVLDGIARADRERMENVHRQHLHLDFYEAVRRVTEPTKRRRSGTFV